MIKIKIWFINQKDTAIKFYHINRAFLVYIEVQKLYKSKKFKLLIIKNLELKIKTVKKSLKKLLKNTKT